MPKDESKPTRRVVLRRERVLVLPEGVEVTSERQKGIANSLGLKPATKFEVVAAWTVIGEFEGASQEKAIEAHAGKAGTPDAKVGVYKAPSVTNWKGGLVYAAPPEPLVERKPLDDAA